MEISGAAQSPMTWPWKKNEGGPRTLEQAITIAKQNGVVIPEDVEFLVDEWDSITHPRAEAQYLDWTVEVDEEIAWSAFYAITGRIVVRLRAHVLESDEAIVAVFAHEMYELNNLRELFPASGGTMSARRLFELIEEGIPRNLHDQAWEFADYLVQQMRKNHGNA